ncbi:MAG: FxDxF family PEP-CTERM protein [Burkholderiaceae bacterium]
MKYKFVALAAAVTLLAGTARADQLNPVVVGSSFSDVVIGSITIATLSNLSGNLFALSSVTGDVFGTPIAFSLQQLTFSNVAVGSLSGDADPSVAGFSFSHVGAGTYVIKASGLLSGPGQIQGTGFVGASYSVSAVPEPESYALLLGGLGVVGLLAYRRRQV